MADIRVLAPPGSCSANEPRIVAPGLMLLSMNPTRFVLVTTGVPQEP